VCVCVCVVCATVGSQRLFHLCLLPARARMIQRFVSLQSGFDFPSFSASAFHPSRTENDFKS